MSLYNKKNAKILRGCLLQHQIRVMFSITQAGIQIGEGGTSHTFLGNCPPTPPLSQH